MDHVLNHAKQTTGEAPRLSPLAAFVAWLTNFLRTIANLKRRKIFPPNWKGHWQGLRELEWYRDQILAFSASHVLAGGSLDDRTDFQLMEAVPENYGACPHTPQAMNRRFIAMAQFRLDPDKYIKRHIRRIARAAGIQLMTSNSGCPLRHASHATSPALRAEEDSNVLACVHIGLSRRSSAKAEGGSRRPALNAQARAPPANPIPDCLFPTASPATPARTPPYARFPSPPSRSSTRPWNCPSPCARPSMPPSPACRSPS